MADLRLTPRRWVHKSASANNKGTSLEIIGTVLIAGQRGIRNIKNIRQTGAGENVNTEGTR